MVLSIPNRTLWYTLFDIHHMLRECSISAPYSATQCQHPHTLCSTYTVQLRLYVTHTAILLCLLHISRSDAPIGLRCSRRQIGTKPSKVASGPYSHWPNGAQCVHLHRLVRWAYGERTVKESYFITTPSERQLHCTPPDGLPMRP